MLPIATTPDITNTMMYPIATNGGMIDNKPDTVQIARPIVETRTIKERMMIDMALPFKVV